MSVAIPPTKEPLVRKALREAFGVESADSLTPMTAGLSRARVYRAVVAGRPWLLRVEMSEPSAFADPHRHYACLSGAAAAGVAPAVRYADPEAGVVITDYVEAQPLSAYPGGAPALAAELARLIAALQATPAFPPLTDYLDGVDAIVADMMRLGVLTEAAAAAPLAAYRAVRDTYPRAAAGELVSSHNDLNPSNLLFDGRRLWLVDWEAAFANDPHVDPATAANWYGLEGEAEDGLLRTVFGAADEAVRARHFLMRQVVRVFVASMMLMVSARSRPPGAAPVADLAGPDLEAVRQGLRAGTLSVGSYAGRIALAKANLRAVAEAVRSPAFAASARRLAA